jgi:hypothetical protein
MKTIRIILKSLGVVITALLLSYLVLLFFGFPKLYAYNLVSRLNSLNIIPILPLVFIYGCCVSTVFLFHKSISIKRCSPAFIVGGIALTILLVSRSPGMAPYFPHNASMTERHTWALNNLEPYYSIAVEKIRTQDAILNDIGEHITIAPAPHSKNGVYDGWAEFTFDIEGDKGQGQCEIEYRHHNSRPHDFTKVKWTFNGQTKLLVRKDHYIFFRKD